MRIGIIAHIKYPIAEPFAGGLEAHTHLLATSLRYRGHLVTVFASMHSDSAIGVEPIGHATAALDDHNVNGGGCAYEHRCYKNLMERILGDDFDIIHNNSLHYLPISMANTLPIPIVTTLHTPPSPMLEDAVGECTAGNAVFVGVSKSICKQWADIRHIPNVVLNGVDLSCFSYQSASDRNKYLIWHGRLVPEKGAHFAIDAARLLGLQLYIAGPIIDTEYFDLEIHPRLGDGVSYLGHLHQRALAKCIAGASAFLCTPRWEEPYGLVVAEALACGVPVAAFERGAIPEILTQGCGVLARPDDISSLAAAAQEALTLSRSACRARAQAVCDSVVMVDGYEDLYLKLTSDGSVRRSLNVGTIATLKRVPSRMALSKQVT